MRYKLGRADLEGERKTKGGGPSYAYPISSSPELWQEEKCQLPWGYIRRPQVQTSRYPAFEYMGRVNECP